MTIGGLSATTKGVLTMCIGVAGLCINDAIAKALGETYPPIQILFMRNLIALPLVAALVFWVGGAAAFRSHRPTTHVLRGICWLSAATTFFTSLTYLGLAEATAIAFVAPILMTALSALLFKETVGVWRWSAVGLGFIGVLIVVRPGMEAFRLVALLPIATAFLYAALMLSARWVDERDSMWTLMLYLVGTGLILSALVAPFFWVPLQSKDMMLFIGIAFFGTIGATLIAQAFRYAQASLLAPLDYTALVWATLMGWVFWRELPDLGTLIGSVVIVISGLIIIVRERKPKPAKLA